MCVTCGPSGPSDFNLDSKSVEFVEFVVEFGWSLLVWGSTKQLQLWSSFEVPFNFNYITISLSLSLSLTHRVQFGVDVVHSKFGVDVVHSKASNLCESSTKYNFDCGSLIRPSYVSPGSSTYRDTRTPVRQRNETRSLSCKQEFYLHLHSFIHS